MSDDLDADLQEIREHIERTVDVDVRSGFGTEAAILERLADQVRDELEMLSDDACDDEVARWRATGQRLLAAQRQLEETWVEATSNDHLDAAFLELNGHGVVALQDAGYTTSEGWEDVHAARDGVPDAWGAVFFHRQDVERAVDGHGLFLAFGAFTRGEDHEPESLRLARLVADVLAGHGLPTEWDGTVSQRIRVPPFPWRKRRSSRSPI